MSDFYNTLPCESGGTHEWGVRSIKKRVKEQFCVKCDLGWHGVNLQMISMLPKEPGLYRGQTYMWKFDGQDWETFNAAPDGVSAHWDMPMEEVGIVTLNGPAKGDRYSGAAGVGL